MQAELEALVRQLDAQGLETLRQSVAAEMSERRMANAFKVEDIHPRMSAEDKIRAAQEIARVLAGGE